MTSQEKIAKGQAKELNNHHFTVSFDTQSLLFILLLLLHIYIPCAKKIYKGSFSISVETSCQINQNFSNSVQEGHSAFMN